jgi:hypothetical protein
MSKARALVLTGSALLLGACSGVPTGAGFGLFGSTPAMPAAASVELDSEPQGAEAKTSLGAACQTPCTLQVPTSTAFSVTFTRAGYAEQTVPVQVQLDEEAASVKFTPNPVFAELGPASGAKKKKPAAKPAPKPTAAAPSASGQ